MQRARACSPSKSNSSTGLCPTESFPIASSKWFAADTPAKNSRTAATVTEYEVYVVQRGATLSAISRAYGVSVDAIRKANNMTSDVLRVGQSLKIPRK